MLRVTLVALIPPARISEYLNPYPPSASMTTARLWISRTRSSVEESDSLFIVRSPFKASLRGSVPAERICMQGKSHGHKDKTYQIRLPARLDQENGASKKEQALVHFQGS